MRQIKMQYRCALSATALVDAEWHDLIAELIFSDFWLPRFFEFRAVPVEPPTFVFDPREVEKTLKALEGIQL